MKTTLHRWLSANWVILANSGSLVGTTAITSGLGFVYWWAAARLFSPAAVGIASAAISAMMLLGTMGMLGLGTLLISELPGQRHRAGSLITVSLLVAGAISAALGVLFALAAPSLAAELEPLARGVGSVTLFALGVALTALTLVLDQALIGLLRGELQLWRNAFFSVVKLVALALVGIWFGDSVGLSIYATWVIGNLLSLAVLASVLAFKGVRIVQRPQWHLLGSLKRAALKHHALNLAVQAPALVLPLLVTALLSATVNASFYVAWMLAGFAFMIPMHLSTVLHAVGAADPLALASKLRFTLKLSLLAGTLVSLTLIVTAHQVLSLFGSSYAEEAEWNLRILALGVFPVIIKVHYVAIARVRRRIGRAAVLMALGGVLEVSLAALGASIGGLPGLGVGLVIAISLEAALTARTVYRAAYANFQIAPRRQALGDD